MKETILRYFTFFLKGFSIGFIVYCFIFLIATAISTGNLGPLVAFTIMTMLITSAAEAAADFWRVYAKN